MSTITKEQIDQYANAARLIQVSDFDKGKLITVVPDHMLELARIAVGSLEAEPVEWRVAFTLDGQSGSDFEKTFENQAKMNEVISLHERAGFRASITPLYSAPPAPVSVPDAATAIRACMEEFPESVHDIVEECAAIAESACRAAMLNGDKS
ncbi:hypothetical protein [Enterobacter sp. A103]|uniref:hypothetical protein n=1 Tax=Enterobacter sp. A103 TaxID=3102785 RepID=UPI002ACA2FB3|nr:hypothetical protein [Enterobacter sp. A103]MDZ5639023.1 hypothetical protein [Enterobacter sp. A103]